MYPYFPGNYTWNAAASIALAYGGSLADVDAACAPLMDLWEDADAEATAEFSRSWSRVAARANALVRQELQQGRRHAAALRLRRAALYHFVAERLATPACGAAVSEYAVATACFRAATEIDEACEPLAVSWRTGTLPALFVPARGEQPAPCAIVVDSFAGAKELTCLSPLVHALAARGIACLVVDAPGHGESLRLKGLVETPEIEHAVSACVDVLRRRPGVDGGGTGVIGIGLGGYYAVRAAAFDPRLAFAVGVGGVYDWSEVLRAQFGTEGSVSSWPHPFERLKRRLGQSSIDRCLEVAGRMHLRDIAPRLHCPLLLLHGADDRELPLAQAQRTYDACTGSAARQLSVRDATHGGADHAGIDDPLALATHIADWIPRALAAGPAALPLGTAETP